MFKKLKIGKKLIVSFVLVTLLTSLSGTTSLYLMNVADTKYSDALENYGFSQGDIGLLMSTLNNNSANIMKLIASDDPQIVQQANQSIQENISKINDYMAAVEKSIVGEKEQEYYNTISKNLPEFTEHAQEVIRLAEAGQDEEAMRVYQGEAKEHIDLILNAVQSLMDSNITVGNQLSRQLSSTNQWTLVGIMVLIAVSVTVSVLIAIYMARSIARPMTACSERIVKLSMGDLKSPVPQVKTQDETGVLAKATEDLIFKLNRVVTEMTSALGEMANGNFNISHVSEYAGDFGPLHTSTVKIIDSLNDALGQINEAADQVSSGSEQVSIGAQSLSQGATEQASSIQELAATIDEVSQKIKTNAQDALDARNKASEVGEEMAQSNEYMHNMIAAMERISKSSSEIENIIKTIEDIAFQTNILALNAAVEAARAGTAGKGFAVVADEVRNLATKSAEASQNTSELIANSLSAVEEGSKIVDDTANSLLVAVEGANEVVKTVDRISEASTEQAESISQITVGIDQISSVVQTNSATAEESAAASEELSGQAQVMKALVSKFQLKNGMEDPM